MKRHVHWAAGLLFGLLCAEPAWAQRPLVIIVKLDCKPSSVSIAIDHSDASLNMTFKDGYWTTFWLDNRKKGSLREAPLSASLRLGGYRTYCRNAEPAKADDDANAAVFTFECDKSPASNLEVQALKKDSRAVQYQYERILEPPSSRVKDLPCTEGNTPDGWAEIKDVRLVDEKFGLRFGEVFTKLNVTLTNLPLHFTTKQVFYALTRDGGNGKSAPRIPQPAMELEQQRLQNSGLHHVDIKVK